MCRRKKERAIRRDIADAQSFAQAQNSKTRISGFDGTARQRRELMRDDKEEREEDEDPRSLAIDQALSKAQLRMMLQQRRLKSARLEMIECLREQQKIQAEMRLLREQLLKKGEKEVAAGASKAEVACCQRRGSMLLCRSLSHSTALGTLGQQAPCFM